MIIEASSGMGSFVRHDGLLTETETGQLKKAFFGASHGDKIGFELRDIPVTVTVARC